MDNLKAKLTDYKNFILDLIFPRQCLGCGEEGVDLCSCCFDKIDINNKDYCALCHQELFLSKVCPNCKKESSLLNIWVAADYNNEILQDLIHNLKYKHIENLSIVLADLIIKYLQKKDIFSTLQINNQNTCLVAVPLHKKRYLERGFNQSYLLAERLGHFYNIEVKDLLKRKINTVSQVNLNRQERKNNISNAFALNDVEIFANKKIILIDDVITTGSTLNECARVLAEKGFRDIYALVIAQREE